jgi:glyoxylase-like metal-dependent hydrolase (beta-lactamase superfamily II)
MARGNMPGLARITFTDQTAVFLGGVEVQAHYMGRGHTNGDAVIYYPDLRTVHAGDLLNEAGPFADYSAGASALEWPRTFDNILRLDFDTIIPGHGKVMTRAEFQAYKQRMETFVTRMSDLVRQQTRKEDVVTKLKVDDLTPWNLGTKSAFMTKSLDGFYEEVSKTKAR